jgi:hypothetical protein
MKQHSVSSLVICLRICVTAFILCMLSLFLFSFVTTSKLGEDIWQQLGLNKQQGTEGVYKSFTGGYLYYYQARNAKNIAAGNRVAVAKDLLGYSKQYVNSDEFKKAYGLERTNAKPAEPVLKAIRNKAEIQKEEISKTEKSIKDFEKNIKALDAATQKSMMPVLDEFNNILKGYQDPNNPYFENLLLYDKNENQQRLARYKMDVENWETNYPADYSPVIKKRLQKFLDITKDVDFNAELKISYNKKVFVNPVYERKPTEWKQAFRAGKEVTDMARAFVERWLGEMK